MQTKSQAESCARQAAWQHKQTMYVVERNGKFFAASAHDLKTNPATVLATFEPIRHRAGAKQIA